MIFVIVIISVVYFTKGSSLPLNALVIGGTLGLSATALGGISGGCLNPAVGVAQVIGQRLAYGTDKVNPKTKRIFVDTATLPLIYCIGPLVGAAIAGFYGHLNVWAK